MPPSTFTSSVHLARTNNGRPASPSLLSVAKAWTPQTPLNPMASPLLGEPARSEILRLPSRLLCTARLRLIRYPVLRFSPAPPPLRHQPLVGFPNLRFPRLRLSPLAHLRPPQHQLPRRGGVCDLKGDNLTLGMLMIVRMYECMYCSADQNIVTSGFAAVHLYKKLWTICKSPCSNIICIISEGSFSIHCCLSINYCIEVGIYSWPILRLHSTDATSRRRKCVLRIRMCSNAIRV